MKREEEEEESGKRRNHKSGGGGRGHEFQTRASLDKAPRKMGSLPAVLISLPFPGGFFFRTRRCFVFSCVLSTRSSFFFTNEWSIYAPPSTQKKRTTRPLSIFLCVLAFSRFVQARSPHFQSSSCSTLKECLPRA